MRKFKFRLERALRFAGLRENQKKTQVAATLQRIRFLDKYIVKLDSKLQQALEISSREVNTLQGEAHRQSVVPTMDELKRMQKLLVEEKAALETQKQEMNKLSQRRRSLESLREKHMADFKLSETRAEQKRIDDMVSVRTARALTSEGRD